MNSLLLTLIIILFLFFIKTHGILVDKNGNIIINNKKYECSTNFKTQTPCGQKVISSDGKFCLNNDQTFMIGTGINYKQCLEKITETSESLNVTDNCNNNCGVKGIYKDLNSKITNNVNDLNLKITNNQNDLNSKITNNTNDLNSKITNNANLISTNTANINSKTTDISEINQKINQILEENNKMKKALGETWIVSEYLDLTTFINALPSGKNIDNMHFHNNELYFSVGNCQLFKYDFNSKTPILIAGSGYTGSESGDGGDAKSATFLSMYDFAFDSNENIYITGSPNIRKLENNQQKTVSSLNSGFTTTHKIIYNLGNIYFSNNHAINRINVNDKTLTNTFAGSDSTPECTDGSGSNARFNSIQGLTNIGDDLYVAMWGCGCIKKVSPTGEVSTKTGKCDSAIEDGFIKIESLRAIASNKKDTLYFYGNSLNMIYSVTIKSTGYQQYHSGPFTRMKTGKSKIVGNVNDVYIPEISKLEWYDNALYYWTNTKIYQIKQLSFS